MKTQLKMNEIPSFFLLLTFSNLDKIGICLDTYWLLIQVFLLCLK